MSTRPAAAQLAALKPELIQVALTPFQQNGLDERFERHAPELDTLDGVTTQVVRQLNAEERSHEVKMQQLQNAIERKNLLGAALTAAVRRYAGASSAQARSALSGRRHA